MPEPVVAPEPVVSSITKEYKVHVEQALGVMVAIMAVRHELEGLPGRMWVDTVMEKLNSVGVKTLRDFMVLVLMLNHTLGKAGYL